MSCHYCGRQGSLTGDHKLPRVSGGTRAKKNMLPACMMCNKIKGEQDYKLFCISFQFFLREHGLEYRQADDTDGKQIRKWRIRFSAWQKDWLKSDKGAALKTRLAGRTSS